MDNKKVKKTNWLSEVGSSAIEAAGALFVLVASVSPTVKVFTDKQKNGGHGEINFSISAGTGLNSISAGGTTYMGNGDDLPNGDCNANQIKIGGVCVDVGYKNQNPTTDKFAEVNPFEEEQE